MAKKRDCAIFPSMVPSDHHNSTAINPKLDFDHVSIVFWRWAGLTPTKIVEEFVMTVAAPVAGGCLRTGREWADREKAPARA
jgi:hypothetical protein